ncbi:MAG: ribosome silencing factor [Coriobacteriia bacterium]|nr:ribosome silencing factor [Coriobacteriia bacterium]
MNKEQEAAKAVALIAAQAASEKKATDIIIQEVKNNLRICDYFVIVSGANNRQVDSIVDAVEEKLRVEAGVKPIGREGLDELGWVLLDFGDVVVHVFQPELRDFYRLETLWGDSPIIDVAEAGITDPEYSERISKLLSLGSEEPKD